MFANEVQLLLDLLLAVLLGGGQFVLDNAGLLLGFLRLEQIHGGSHFVQLVSVLEMMMMIMGMMMEANQMIDD